MQVLSSLYDIPIYAPSAAYAPTNSGDVSAIASGYVEGAVSGKLDTTAFSDVSGTFLTAVPPGYATESYVDSAVSGKLDVTASSLFITALPDDLATTGDVASAVSGKLDKSASGEFYPMSGNPSGFLTAHQSLAGLATVEYVDSSVSSKLDTTAYDSAQFYSTSNPSGFITGVDLTPYQEKSAMTAYQPVGDYAYNSSLDGYIPTSESGKYVTSLDGYATTAYVESSVSGKLDVTAQVVTATGTQLYAGTAHLTSVNGAPISASRAGNAANASMANSAYYDGTGRLISALPDSAAVSAIASSYAESAVSGKQDASAMSAYQLTAGMSGYYTTANESGYVDSAYVESQVSGKQDTLTFDWDEDSAISSINGSALAGNGGVDESAVSAIASAYAESAASGKQASGNYISAKGLTQTITNAAGNYGVAFGGPVAGLIVPGLFVTGNFGTAYYKDNELNLNRSNMKIAFNIGGGGPRISSMAVAGVHSYMYLFASGRDSATYSDTGIEFKDSGSNTVALYNSATYGNITSMYDTVSANSASWAASGIQETALGWLEVND